MTTEFRNARTLSLPHATHTGGLKRQVLTTFVPPAFLQHHTARLTARHDAAAGRGIVGAGELREAVPRPRAVEDTPRGPREVSSECTCQRPPSGDAMVKEVLVPVLVVPIVLLLVARSTWLS